MTRYYGGQVVKGGLYLRRSTLEFEPVVRGGGILPGDKGARYIQMPLPAVTVVGPLMGLLFVIFLPLVGVVGIIGLLTYRGWQSAQLVGRKAQQSAQLVGRKAKQSVVAGWERGIARLSRRGNTPAREEPKEETEGKPAEFVEPGR